MADYNPPKQGGGGGLPVYNDPGAAVQVTGQSVYLNAAAGIMSLVSGYLASGALNFLGLTVGEPNTTGLTPGAVAVDQTTPGLWFLTVTGTPDKWVNLLAGGGGSSSIVADSWAFDHTTLAALVAGVKTGITLPDGAVLSTYAPFLLATPVAWDSLNPTATVGISAADVTSAGLFSASLTVADAAYSGNIYRMNPGRGLAGNYFRVEGGPQDLWLAVNNGVPGGGSPGSTVGSGLLIVQYAVPTPV